jgi:hypothetical protein
MYMLTFFNLAKSRSDRTELYHATVPTILPVAASTCRVLRLSFKSRGLLTETNFQQFAGLKPFFYNNF